MVHQMFSTMSLFIVYYYYPFYHWYYIIGLHYLPRIATRSFRQPTVCLFVLGPHEMDSDIAINKNFGEILSSRTSSAYLVSQKQKHEVGYLQIAIHVLPRCWADPLITKPFTYQRYNPENIAGIGNFS